MNDKDYEALEVAEHFRQQEESFKQSVAELKSMVSKVDLKLILPDSKYRHLLERLRDHD